MLRLLLLQLEKKLRASKFGYRASYISKAVSMIIEKGGTAWLENLKQLSYKEAKIELMTIPGIGPKVRQSHLTIQGHISFN